VTPQTPYDTLRTTATHQRLGSVSENRQLLYRHLAVVFHVMQKNEPYSLGDPPVLSSESISCCPVHADCNQLVPYYCPLCAVTDMVCSHNRSQAIQFFAIISGPAFACFGTRSGKEVLLPHFRSPRHCSQRRLIALHNTAFYSQSLPRCLPVRNVFFSGGRTCIIWVEFRVLHG
jgi:hypothetical protein